MRRTCPGIRLHRIGLVVGGVRENCENRLRGRKGATGSVAGGPMQCKRRRES
jgi:hypothetical protein